MKSWRRAGAPGAHLIRDRTLDFPGDNQSKLYAAEVHVDEETLHTVSSSAAAFNDETDLSTVNASGVRERWGWYRTG